MFALGPRALRSHLVLGLAVLLTDGCKNAEKEQARLDEIQRNADETIAKIRSEAADKVAVAQKKIDDLQNMLVDAGAQAKSQAELEISKAKSEEEKLAALATEALKKARAAYQESERRQLDSLSKDFDDLRSKAASAPPKVKAQVDRALKGIEPKKDAVKKDIDSFDAATLQTLKNVKTKTDKAMTSLKQSIASARAKLK